MGFYTGALRFLVHLAGIAIVLGCTVAAYGSKHDAVGALLGFAGGLLVAGFVLGVIALAFEIRDKLEQIRVLLASRSGDVRLASISEDVRREPTI